MRTVPFSTRRLRKCANRSITDSNGRSAKPTLFQKESSSPSSRPPSARQVYGSSVWIGEERSSRLGARRRREWSANPLGGDSSVEERGEREESSADSASSCP